MDMSAVDIAINGSVANVTSLHPFSKTATESVVETANIMKCIIAVIRVMKIISTIPGMVTFKISLMILES